MFERTLNANADARRAQSTYPRAEIQRFFLAALEELGDAREIPVITVPAPRASLATFLAAVPLPHGLIWRPPAGKPAFAGVGAAACIRLDGPERMTQLRAGAAEVFARLVDRRYPSCPAAPPRLFGGLAFAVGTSSAAPWRAFGDGCFILPAWCYGHVGDEAVLSAAAPSDPSERARWIERAPRELAQLLDALVAAPSASSLPPGPRLPSDALPEPRLHQTDPQSWRAHIEAIRAAIHAGRFEKIVAARRCVVDAGRRLDDIAVLARLVEEYPACTGTLFRQGDESFVGASPERLFEKRGDRLVTQALAGTIAAGDPADVSGSTQAETLLRSHKDMIEHALVVRAITDALRPLCAELTAAERPQIERVRRILHLNTPIQARLLRGVHALDVLDALHPTPAVGGVPRLPASRWITEHEPDERGWYTGPLGWIDAEGDGELVVAIRCGVLRDSRAYIFTGAGIVGDSEPDAEYAETALKQQPLLSALGALP